MAGAQTEEDPLVRCGCANDQCSCTVVAGDGITVEGTGSKSNPLVVSLAPVDTVVDPGGGGGGGTVTTVDRLPGEMVMYGGAVAPTGWLICNGQAVNRNTYAALFGIIGTAFGAGDGTATFNLPNFGGRTPMGQNGTYPRGSSGGTVSNTLTVAQLPSHTHGINHDHPPVIAASDGLHDHPSNHSPTRGTSSSTFAEGVSADRVTDSNLIQMNGAHTHTVDLPPYTGNSGTAGGGATVNNLPPYLGVNMIIKF